MERSTMNKMLGWLQCQVFGHVVASCTPYRRSASTPAQRSVKLICARCGRPVTVLLQPKR
jgi:hypothetical protein